MKRLWISLLLAGAATTGYAQKETAPSPGPPRDFSLPEKHVGQLPNGLRTTLVPYGEIPKVNISLIIRTGNVHEGPNQVWLADLTGKLMQEGTDSLDAKALARAVARMGGDVNISVGPDQTSISGSVLSEFAPAFIRILADVAMHPAFPASEIDRLKADLKRQLAVQSSVPQNVAASEFASIIFKDHPYGRYFPTEKMLDSYTLDMVKAFYDANFGAKRSALYVVGKFDEGSVESTATEAFSSWKAGPDISYPKPTPTQTNQITIVDRPGAPQSTVILGLPTLQPQDSDYIALQVTNALLGGAFSSRITANLREDKGYTYSPYSIVSNSQGVSVWSENADVTTQFTGASLKEISKEISRLQQEPPSQEELSGIQRYAAGIFVLQNSSPGGIIAQLNFIDAHGLDDSYLTNRVRNIYAVTPQKVSEIARRDIRYDDMTMVIVGDRKTLEKQIKAEDLQSRLR